MTRRATGSLGVFKEVPLVAAFYVHAYIRARPQNLPRNWDWGRSLRSAAVANRPASAPFCHDDTLTLHLECHSRCPTPVLPGAYV